MALSNWDTCAFDLDGKPIRGSFISPRGVEVEIYKNWLYVRDSSIAKPTEGGKAGGRNGGTYEFARNTVMEIQHGFLHYRDVEISAVRGPQEGVYALVWSTEYQETPKGEKYVPPVRTGMLGCGVYGFDPDISDYDEAWIGTTQEALQFLINFAVTGENHGDFRKYIDKPGVSDRQKSLFEEINFLATAKRFNQGDAYFADRLPGLELDQTPVGEQNPTIMHKIINSQKA